MFCALNGGLNPVIKSVGLLDAPVDKALEDDGDPSSPPSPIGWVRVRAVLSTFDIKSVADTIATIPS